MNNRRIFPRMPKGRPKGFDEQAVLERAMLTFWRKGFNGASMSLLLREMGISRQSLYDTFGDKRRLFLRSLELYQDREVAAITKLLAGLEPEREKLFSVISHYRAMAHDDAPKGCFLVNSLINMEPDDTELAAIVADSFSKIRAEVLRTITSAIQKGLISSDQSPAQATSGLVTGLIGLAASSKSLQSREEADQTVASLLHSLGLR